MKLMSYGRTICDEHNLDITLWPSLVVKMRKSRVARLRTINVVGSFLFWTIGVEIVL